MKISNLKTLSNISDEQWLLDAISILMKSTFNYSITLLNQLGSGFDWHQVWTGTRFGLAPNLTNPAENASVLAKSFFIVSGSCHGVLCINTGTKTEAPMLAQLADCSVIPGIPPTMPAALPQHMERQENLHWFKVILQPAKAYHYYQALEQSHCLAAASGEMKKDLDTTAAGEDLLEAASTASHPWPKTATGQGRVRQATSNTYQAIRVLGRVGDRLQAQ